MTPTDEEQARAILGGDSGFVRVAAQGIIIASGYSEALARLLRWVPKASWRPEMRAWLVPFAGADAVRSVLPEIQRLAEAAAEERKAERVAKEDVQIAQFKEGVAALDRCTAEAQALQNAKLGQEAPLFTTAELAALIAKLRATIERLEALRKP